MRLVWLKNSFAMFLLSFVLGMLAGCKSSGGESRTRSAEGSLGGLKEVQLAAKYAAANGAFYMFGSNKSVTVFDGAGGAVSIAERGAVYESDRDQNFVVRFENLNGGEVRVETMQISADQSTLTEVRTGMVFKRQAILDQPVAGLKEVKLAAKYAAANGSFYLFGDKRSVTAFDGIGDTMLTAERDAVYESKQDQIFVVHFENLSDGDDRVETMKLSADQSTLTEIRTGIVFKRQVSAAQPLNGIP